jgi:cytoskeletal protein CcmA (bactofilin family)/predicted RNA-binding Zn-ribbon protein involved in translation (DUF1610 family)
VANTRRQPPEKISADCPHCGFSQLESAFAKSTFCRKCGEHYSIEKLLAKEAGSLSAPGFLDRLSRMISRETVREISCFSCAATQQVSSAAESSLCPKCGSYIDLRDFKITGPFGRSIQTQGEVIITSKGDLSSQRVLCGGARIEGKLRGQLVCTGVVAVRMQGQITGGIESPSVVIEKKSAVEFAKPIKAQSVEINGKASGTVVCSGRVTINKHGALEGAIYARSIVIEKGGIFSGELHIGEENLDAEAVQEAVIDESTETSELVPEPQITEEAVLPAVEVSDAEPVAAQEELFEQPAPPPGQAKPGVKPARYRARAR